MELRLGFITPSSNTWVEPLSTAMVAGLGGGVTAHFTRLKVTSIGLAAEQLAQFEAEPMVAAARLLADCEVQAIAWNGTSGSWIGLDADRATCRAIEEATGVPATTATLAIVEALHAYGVRSYGLAVPYLADVAARIVDTYRAEGLECSTERHLGIARNADFGRVGEAGIESLLRSAAPGAEAIAVVCTNLAAAPLVEKLERSLGIPIVDSITATVWKALELAAPGLILPGWGDLALTGAIRSRVQPLLEQLLAATGASRATFRVDLPERGLQVDRVAGEAVLPGVPSIRLDGSLDQWAMPTVKWLSQHRRLLVQDDFSSGDPPVSPELIRVYGVQAQMLGPVTREGRMIGWISVHQVGRERSWSERDRELLRDACAAVKAMLDARSPAGLSRTPTGA